VGELFRSLQQAFGPVLVLVNNAGMRADGLAPQLDEQDWAQVIDTNLSGAYRTTKLALGPMLRARFGRIVNVASVVGPRANAGQANYAASKAGLIGFTKTVAVEVARRGVTVNAVAPGLIETKLTEGISNGLAERVPARRTGTRTRLPRASLPRLRAGRLRDRSDPDGGRGPQRLTEYTRTERSHQMATAVTDQEVENTLYEAMAETGADRSQLSRDASFEQLDVDSLDLVELAQVVEDEFGVELKGEDMKDLRTVGAGDRSGGRQGIMSRRVVITGMGAVTPLGLGAESLFRRWAHGECGVEDGVARCDQFEVGEFLSQKEVHPQRSLYPVRARCLRSGPRGGRVVGWCSLPAGRGRLCDRHRDRRPRFARAGAQRAARKGAAKDLGAVGAVDDGKCRCRSRGDAPPPARADLRGRLRLRSGGARDRDPR